MKEKQNHKLEFNTGVKTCNYGYLKFCPFLREGTGVFFYCSYFDKEVAESKDFDLLRSDICLDTFKSE